MTSSLHTPRHVLERIASLEADALGIQSVIDIDASASGDVFRAESIVRPGGGAGPLHRHRFQEERFELLDGEIVGRIGSNRLRVRAGETFVVPPDAPHTFTVEADEPARFITEFRPGLRLAEFFAELFWLADNGHLDARGRIDPLQAAVLARAYPLEFFYVPKVPPPLQQAIARPLAWLGRRRGYSADPAGLGRLTPLADAAAV
jgi:mannose-6-phosphate isomerase-like protein (cupin superfamily)